jgi:hypothetical protein
VFNSHICSPSLVASPKVLLDTLQECKGNLPPKLLIGNYKISYNPVPAQDKISMSEIQRYKKLRESLQNPTTVMQQYSFFAAPSII